MNSSSAISGEYILSGDKSGYLSLLRSNNLELVSTTRACSSTIQSISTNKQSGEFAALALDYTVIHGVVKDGNISINKKISGINYIKDDDYALQRSESQAVSLNPLNNYLAFRNPDVSCSIIDINDDYKVISVIRFENDSDIVTVMWANEWHLLVGFVNGVVGRYDIRSEQAILVKLEGINESIHWFEKIDNEKFILATDARCVVDLNPNTMEYRIGDKFSRDDFEHISYDQQNKIAYATSFDRNIYQIDINTLTSIKVIYHASFKLRWLEVFYENNKPFLIAQVRNGSLLRIDPEAQNVTHTVKNTPPALWSYTKYNGDMLFFGEEGVFEQKEGIVYPSEKYANVKNDYSEAYIKRAQSLDDILAFGGTSGLLHIYIKNDNELKIDLGSPVRDLCIKENGDIYVVVESGQLIHCEAINNYYPVTVYTSPRNEPLWSLAYNKYFKFVAIGERYGKISILDTNTHKEIITTSSKLPKRMKWIDDNRLITSSSANLDLIEYKDGEWHHYEDFYFGAYNTVEDFIVIDDNRVLLGINYDRYIQGWHVGTGEVLQRSYWGRDYAKGIMNLDDKDQFIVYGRNAEVRKFNIHDNELLPVSIYKYDYQN